MANRTEDQLLFSHFGEQDKAGSTGPAKQWFLQVKIGNTATAKTRWKRTQAKQHSEHWEFLQWDHFHCGEDATHWRVHSYTVNFVEVVSRKKLV
jgi:hypothetical protein